MSCTHGGTGAVTHFHYAFFLHKLVDRQCAVGAQHIVMMIIIVVIDFGSDCILCPK